MASAHGPMHTAPHESDANTMSSLAPRPLLRLAAAMTQHGTSTLATPSKLGRPPLPYRAEPAIRLRGPVWARAHIREREGVSLIADLGRAFED